MWHQSLLFYKNSLDNWVKEVCLHKHTLACIIATSWVALVDKKCHLWTHVKLWHGVHRLFLPDCVHRIFVQLSSCGEFESSLSSLVHKTLNNLFCILISEQYWTVKRFLSSVGNGINTLSGFTTSISSNPCEVMLTMKQWLLLVLDKEMKFH